MKTTIVSESPIPTPCTGKPSSDTTAALLTIDGCVPLVNSSECESAKASKTDKTDKTDRTSTTRTADDGITACVTTTVRRTEEDPRQTDLRSEFSSNNIVTNGSTLHPAAKGIQALPEITSSIQIGLQNRQQPRKRSNGGSTLVIPPMTGSSNSSILKKNLRKTSTLTLFIAIFVLSTMSQIALHVLTHQSSSSTDFARYEPPMTMSVVIITHRSHINVLDLLKSIKLQRTNFPYEIIIIDTACMAGLENDVQSILWDGFSITKRRKRSLEADNIDKHEDNDEDTDDAATDYSLDMSFSSIYGFFFGATISSSYSSTVLTVERRLAFKYIEACNNPDYNTASDIGLKATSTNSKLVLFLTDNLVLRDPWFLQSMLNLYYSNDGRIGGVGCTIFDISGDSILDAGSIVWNDASIYNYAQGRKDVKADDLMYARPTDFAPASCFMISKQDAFYTDWSAESTNYNPYYKLLDIQFKIQYHLGKSIWVQPAAVAVSSDHTSILDIDDKNIHAKSGLLFYKKWKPYFVHHLPSTPRRVQPIRAADVRSRHSILKHLHPNRFDRLAESVIQSKKKDSKLITTTIEKVKAAGVNDYNHTILYVCEKLPSRFNGNRRAYDTILFLNNLGYRVTVIQVVDIAAAEHRQTRTTGQVANLQSIKGKQRLLEKYDQNSNSNFNSDPTYPILTLQQIGVEVLTEASGSPSLPELQRLLLKRPCLYDTIIINEFNTFQLFQEFMSIALPNLLKYTTIIYDIGSSLRFFQHEHMLQKYRSLTEDYSKNNSMFDIPPGLRAFVTGSRNTSISLNKVESLIHEESQLEIDLLTSSHIDTIITTTPQENDIVNQLMTLSNVGDRNKVYSTEAVATIGHCTVETKESRRSHSNTRSIDSTTTALAAFEVSKSLDDVPSRYDPLRVSSTENPFLRRAGILLIGEFVDLNNNNIQQKGESLNTPNCDLDAVWYFLKNIYPLLLKDNDWKLTEVIIAGRNIPNILYDLIEEETYNKKFITFLESPTDMMELYNKVRAVVVPHLYHSGSSSTDNYMLHEAMAAGVPLVLSTDTAERLNLHSSRIVDIACVGADELSLKNCILSVYNDPNQWDKLRTNGLAYVENDVSHRREAIKKDWANVLQTASNHRKDRQRWNEAVCIASPVKSSTDKSECAKLESDYFRRYPDTRPSARQRIRYKKGVDHFLSEGYQKGYIYNQKHEMIYLQASPSLKQMIADGVYKSGFDHYKREGMNIPGFVYSVYDELTYRMENPDIDSAVRNKDFETGWAHFMSYGKAEGRKYGCW